jgi:hypothetical protein
MSSIGPEIPAHLLQRRATPPPQEEQQGGEGHPSDATARLGPPIPNLESQRTPAVDAHADDSDGSDDYTPALPPELLAARSAAPQQRKPVLGPTLPPQAGVYGSDEEEEIGPRPPSGVSSAREDGVRQFLESEERRRKLLEVRVLSTAHCQKVDYFILVHAGGGQT